MKKILNKSFFKNIKENILKHKKISIICGVLLIILIIFIIYNLFFSSTSVGEPMETIEDRIRDKAESTALVYVKLTYDVGYVSANVATVRPIDDSEYEVYGKITATDNYGDQYSGNFNGTCTVDESEVIHCDLDYNKLYRDR